MVGKIYIYGMTKILNCGNSKHAANHEHSDTKSKVAALQHSCCHTVHGSVKKLKLKSNKQPVATAS